MRMRTALFDFDGVIADTEPLYDRYWNEAAERYGLGIPNFADLIKGTTLPDLMAKYFHSQFRRSDQRNDSPGPDGEIFR